MDLELKIQAVQPDNITSTIYTISHQFPKINDELLKKRGQLFLCMYINSSEEFDLRGATKLFIDHISEGYYVINEYSPLKNLEKVFKSGINLLENFRSKNDENILGNPSNNTKISATLGLIWNRVFYTVNYGNNPNYLIRGSGARDLNSEEQNHLFSTNSLILENDDVVIIGTDEFKELFPVKNIVENLTGISTKIATSPNDDLISMLIIKVNDKSETKKRTNRNPVAIHNNLFNYFSNLKNKLKHEKSLSDEFKVYQAKKTTPISSISGIPQKEDSDITIRSSRSLRLSTKKQYPVFSLTIGSIILLILIIGGVFLYRYTTANRLQVSDGEVKEMRRQESTNKTEENAQKETSPRISADIVLTQQDLSENLETSVYDLFGTDQLIFYSDKNKSLNIYDISKKSNTVVEKNTTTIEQVKCTEKFCFAVTRELVLVFDPSTPTKVDKYSYSLDQTGIDVGYFGSSAYLLTSNQIYSFRFGDVNPTFTPWISGEGVLSNGRYMLINSDIYVLDGNTLKRFTSGKPQAFNVKQDNLQLSKLLSSDRTTLYAFSSENMKVFKIALPSGEVTSTLDLKEKGFTEPITNLDISITKGKTPSAIVKYDNQIFKVNLL